MRSTHSFRFIPLGVVPALLLCASQSISQEMLTFIDESGVIVISDTQNDTRLQPYKIGDFERIALRQKMLPHEGMALRLLIASQNRNARKANSQRKAHPNHSYYDAIIFEEAQKNNISFALIKAVIAVESAFQKDVVSSAGAQGLMQLMPQTADELGVKNPFDPQQNIRGGARYLAALLHMFPHEELAIAAYNSGPGRVRRLGRVPHIRETQTYVKKVLKLRDSYAQTQPRHGINPVATASLLASQRRRESK